MKSIIGSQIGKTENGGTVKRGTGWRRKDGEKQRERWGRQVRERQEGRVILALIKRDELVLLDAKDQCLKGYKIFLSWSLSSSSSRLFLHIVSFSAPVIPYLFLGTVFPFPFLHLSVFSFMCVLLISTFPEVPLSSFQLVLHSRVFLPEVSAPLSVFLFLKPLPLLFFVFLFLQSLPFLILRLSPPEDSYSHYSAFLFIRSPLLSSSVCLPRVTASSPPMVSCSFKPLTIYLFCFSECILSIFSSVYHSTKFLSCFIFI